MFLHTRVIRRFHLCQYNLMLYFIYFVYVLVDSMSEKLEVCVLEIYILKKSYAQEEMAAVTLASASGVPGCRGMSSAKSVGSICIIGIKYSHM